MSRRKEITELAALLDGELEAGRAEQLYTQLQNDPELKTEYEKQRVVKAMLAQLPQAAAPDFMATRVLGEISKKSNQTQVWRWRTLTAALAGFTACLVLVSGVMYLNRAPNQTYIASQPVGNLEMGREASFSQPGSAIQLAPDWRDLPVSAEGDDGVEGFLRFANRAHGYTKYVNSTDAIKPDLSSAILVLDGKIYILDEGTVKSDEEE